MRPRALLFLCIAAVVPLAAYATPITYTYTGNDYTSATYPFTTSESIDGSFSVATPIATDFSGIITPSTFSFSNGQATLTQASNLLDSYFYIDTNSTGAIVFWSIFVEDNDDYVDTTPSYDQADHYYQTGIFSGSLVYASNDSEPGAWTSNAPPLPPPAPLATAPELSSLFLLGTGLLALCGATMLARRSSLPFAAPL